MESHKKFADKYHLKFSLLSDFEGEVCHKYGVIKKKSIFAKIFKGNRKNNFYYWKKYVDRKNLLQGKSKRSC